jgi:hypothetical protein
LGLGGATADSYNRLSMNTPAVLLNNAGAGIEATVNKAAAGNDAAFAFKTGFSARALIGLLGNDDFSFKVSPNGSDFFDASWIDRTNGQVELPAAHRAAGAHAAPSPPPAGQARRLCPQPRRGTVDRCHAPLGPGLSAAAAFRGEPDRQLVAVDHHHDHHRGSADHLVGTVSTRRWPPPTSPPACGAGADLGGGGGFGRRTALRGLGLLARQCGGPWRLDLRHAAFADHLQATGMGFFGLYGSIAALATTLTLAAVMNCIGIGFQRGTHANWQLVTNDGTGAPTLTDMGRPSPSRWAAC